MARPRKKLRLLDAVDARGHRRIFSRRALQSEVMLEDEHGEPLVILPATDVSTGGLFVRSSIPLRVGAHALLRFALPNRLQPLRLVGQVVRLERKTPESRPTGVGIRFVEVPGDIKTAIEQWLHAE